MANKSCWSENGYTTLEYSNDLSEKLQSILNEMLEDGYSYDAFFYTVVSEAERVLLKTRLDKEFPDEHISGKEGNNEVN